MQESQGKIQISEEELEQRLHAMLTECTAIKNKGNEVFRAQNYPEAEKYYIEGINKIVSYFTEIQSYNCGDLKKENVGLMLKELRNLERSIRGNLSLTYHKEKKEKEAIETLAYILKAVDPDHSQSYLRLITYLLEDGDFLKAKVIFQEAKNKFSGTEQFSSFADIEKKIKEMGNKQREQVKPSKKKNESNFTKLVGSGIIGVSSLLGAAYIIYRYGKDYI